MNKGTLLPSTFLTHDPERRRDRWGDILTHTARGPTVPAGKRHLPQYLILHPSTLVTYQSLGHKVPTRSIASEFGVGWNVHFYSLQIVVKHSLVELHVHTEKGSLLSSVSSLKKSPPQMTLGESQW